MHFILLILHIPLNWCYTLGIWIDDTVFTPFSMGTTAKQVTEEEIAVYGGLAVLIYLIMLLPINASQRFRPDWFRGDWRRALQLFGLAIFVSYAVSVVYIGVLSPTLQLRLGPGGLATASIVAWGALIYRYSKEIVDEKRDAERRAAQAAAKQAAEENA